MSIAAAIAVREGSKRVENKSFLPWLSTNLFEHKCSQLIESGVFDRVYVSSDSYYALDYARAKGMVALERKPELCTDSANISDFIGSIADSVKEEHLLFTLVTCPFFEAQDYRDLVRAYLGDSDASGGRGMQGFTKPSLFLWESGQPLNYNPRQQPRSQDLPTLAFSPVLSVLPTRMVKIFRNVVGCEPVPVMLDKTKAFDIDDSFDYRFALALIDERREYKKQASPHI